MKYLTILFTQLFTILSVLTIGMGIDWIDTGFGLHPVLAGAIAVSTIAIPYLIAKGLIHD